jgi:anti-sigma factor RsiW
MGPLGGHLGARVSALLDGQLSAAEAERAWAHVHSCHLCRDAVEREGWVKTRLAGLAGGIAPAPERLKGSLLGGTPLPALPAPDPRPNRVVMVALGGSAAGVAVLGLVALGLGPSDVPNPDRRAPVTSFGRTETPPPMPTRVPGPVLRPASPAASR